MRIRLIVGVASVVLMGLTGCAPGAADDSGATAAELSVCPQIYEPVCGVNGHTYSNRCTAGRRAIAYVGECQPECAHLVCPAGNACNPVRRTCASTDPCATVRCITGTHCAVVHGVGTCQSVCAGVTCPAGQMCVAVGNAVSCRPAACPPNTRLCRRGHHYDRTPGVCACVPDAPPSCPPNMFLCIRGYHYDGTPGVCGCVPDAHCDTDSDCRLVDDYCGGCACDALTTWQPSRTCTSAVRCFRQPCGGLTAHCVSGACVAR